jgi:hypothetical protein
MRLKLICEVRFANPRPNVRAITHRARGSPTVLMRAAGLHGMGGRRYHIVDRGLAASCQQLFDRLKAGGFHPSGLWGSATFCFTPEVSERLSFLGRIRFRPARAAFLDCRGNLEVLVAK